MSYRQMTMYVAVCNGCGAEHEHDEYAGWSDKATTDENAEADGWTATRYRHLCPRCVAGVIADPPTLRIESAHREPGPADQPLDLGAVQDARADGPGEAA